VLQRLEIVRIAKLAGFTLAEIKVLLEGFSTIEAPAATWKTLARQKLPEVESLITRAQEMKRLLQMGLNCECIQIEECVVLASSGQADGSSERT